MKFATPAALLALLLPSLACADLLAGIRASDGKLIFFHSDDPGVITREVAVTGMQAGAVPVGIDYRAQDRKLYLVGSAPLTNQCQLYTVDSQTGAAQSVGAIFTCGTHFEADFNPAANYMRALRGTANFRVDASTGARTDANNLQYASGDVNESVTPSIAASAYDDNFEGSSAPTLYAIDDAEDMLVRVGDLGSSTDGADSGQLFTVGELGFNVLGGSFDIAGTQDPWGYLFTQFSPQTSEQGVLYQVSLNSGSASFLGKVGQGDLDLRGMTVIPQGDGGGGGGGGGGGTGGGPDDDGGAGTLALSVLAVLLGLHLLRNQLRRRRLGR